MGCCKANAFSYLCAPKSNKGAFLEGKSKCFGEDHKQLIGGIQMN
jgi:hypothetical protein